MADATEVLFIGGGVFGLSAALSLANGKYAENPSAVVVIDRSSSPPEADAASSDINKIVRGDYSDPTYFELALQALDKWTNDKNWNPFFHQSGLLVATSVSGSHGEDYVQKSYENFQQLYKTGRSTSAPVLLSNKEEYDRALGLSGHLTGAAHPSWAYLNKTSGWAYSSGSMQALAQRCRDAGVTFVTGQVNKILEQGDKVTGVELQDGRRLYSQGLVVLSAGSWSSTVLPDLGTKVVATGQVIATIQLAAEEAGQYLKMPVYIDMESGFYVFPPNPDGIIKMALHHRGYINPALSSSGEKTVSTPRTGHFGGEPEENIPKESVVELREQLRLVLPHLAQKPFAATRMCWYADSPDCKYIQK